MTARREAKKLAHDKEYGGDHSSHTHVAARKDSQTPTSTTAA